MKKDLKSKISTFSGAICIRDDRFTSLADANAFFAANPLNVIYELATHIETELTKGQVTALLPKLYKPHCLITSDCDIQVKYRKIVRA